MGRVLAPWRYDDSQAAWDADIVNSVACDIRKVGLIDAVPGSIVSSFVPSRTIQRVKNPTALLYSQFLWNQLTASTTYSISPPALDLFSLLGSKATEDLVLIYLQMKGWLILPSSRQPDTLAYESVLIHRDTRQRAIVQVKTGGEQLVTDDWKGRPERVFLFQSAGLYVGDATDDVICISPADLRSFAQSEMDFLPSNIRTWLGLVQLFQS